MIEERKNSSDVVCLKKTVLILSAFLICVGVALAVYFLWDREEDVPEPPVAESEPVISETPEPEPEPVPVNPLTGLPMDAELVDDRPVAVVINNLKAALPQQGIGQADIIFEVVTEGGITRMLALYQSLEGVETLGSIRSTRTCFVELAMGLDAVLVHAGGSEQAYKDMKSWKTDHMDGVNGIYSYAGAGLFWRDRSRIEGYTFATEHSLITNGPTLFGKLQESGFRLEHEEGYSSGLNFAEDGTPEDGDSAKTITVSFSKYKKDGVFRYDEERGLYLSSEYGAEHIDGNSGEQIAITNVLILQTKVELVGDKYNHTEVDLSSGKGWFACGGKVIPILWEKGDKEQPLRYFTADGEPLLLGQGKSYICIVADDREVTFE